MDGTGHEIEHKLDTGTITNEIGHGLDTKLSMDWTQTRANMTQTDWVRAEHGLSTNELCPNVMGTHY